MPLSSAAFQLYLRGVWGCICKQGFESLPTSAHLDTDLLYSRLTLRNIFLKFFHSKLN